MDQRQVKHLKRFRALHPKQWPSEETFFPTRNPLGRWCKNQCRNLERGTIAPDVKSQLDEIVFPWRVTKTRKRLLRGKSYVQRAYEVLAINETVGRPAPKFP
ncbi:MAG: hypothetical protein V1495_03665 [Pseudomonadota bacterium]